MKSKFLIILLILFSSCISNKLVYTNYESKKNSYFNISIEKNNIFQYSSRQGLISLKSKGNWVKNNDTLILNSFELYKKNYIKLLKQKTIDSNINKVKIIDNIGNAVNKRIVYFNNNFETEYKTNNFGFVKFEEKIKTIHVLTYSNVFKIKLKKNGAFYDLTFKVVPDNMFYSYFKNKKYMIKKNKLIDLETNRIYKTKNSSKN